MATRQAKQHYSWSQLVPDLAEGAQRSYQFLKDNKRAKRFWREPDSLQEMGTAVLQRHLSILITCGRFSSLAGVFEYISLWDWLVTYYMGWFSVCSGLLVMLLGITKRSSYIQNFGINFFFESILHHKGCKLSCWGTEMALDQYL